MEEGIYEKNQNVMSFHESSTFYNLNGPTIRFQGKMYVEEEPGMIKISITDTGPGLNMQHFNTIFSAKPEINTSRRTIGTGLGLHITKLLLSKMGGEMRAYSKADHGTTITMAIPSKSLPSHDPTETLQRSSNELDKRVLIIEDSEFNAFIIKKFLEKMGYQNIDIASDGLSGFERFIEAAGNNVHYNLVTLDIQMPVMDGRDCLKKIREYEIQKKNETF